MKLPNIFKRKGSIARRLTWRVILTVTLVFVIISASIFGVVWFIGSTALLAYTTKGMDVTNEKISNVFTNIEVAVNNNKAVVEENFGNGAKLYDAQKQLLNLNPDIIGAAVAYNPDSKRMKGKCIMRSCFSVFPGPIGIAMAPSLSHPAWKPMPAVQSP